MIYSDSVDSVIHFSNNRGLVYKVWSAFERIVEDSDEPAKYTMMRLKAWLQGKVEESISKLGSLEEAY